MTDVMEGLHAALNRHDRLAVAVSGGVDSLTLAFCAARNLRETLMIHAVSPAVPTEATERVKRYAKNNNWHLKIVESGEFADPEYRANPHNRCYFCKTNLYSTMQLSFDGPIAAGTNTDDLGEYRPGLIAAKEHGVVHPFVEAGVSKAALREIARGFGLTDIADLPAQPCLASRIVTGLRVEPADLAFVHEIETLVRNNTDAKDIRCRLSNAGVIVQTSAALPPAILEEVAKLSRARGRTFLGSQPYERGSAFIVPIK